MIEDTDYLRPPDMLMMTSMLMTSPLAVTLGLSLTIPLAVVGDFVRGTQIGGPTFFFGAGFVLAGFIAVGWADASQRVEEVEAVPSEAEEGPPPLELEGQS